MIGLAVLLFVLGTVILVLFTGYAYGRAEAAAEYEGTIDDLERTIDALLSPGVRFR